MMAGIVAELPGSPSQIRQAGEWLRHTIESAAHEADVADGLIVTTSYQYWQGETGDAFNNVVSDLLEVSRQLSDAAGPLAEKFHVYAGEMERHQNKLDGYLEHARGSGITVNGHEILQPQWVGAVPQGASDPQWDTWRDYRKMRRTYDRLEDDILRVYAADYAWVLENFVSILSEMPNPTLADLFFDNLSTVLGTAGGMTNDYLNSSFTNTIEHLTSSAKAMTEHASEIERLSEASGNPARKARLRELIQEALPEHLRDVAKGAESVAELTRSLRRVADVALGPALDVALAGYDIFVAGEEPIDVGINIAGGAAGTAVAVALGATPVGWGIVVIAGAGLLGGEIVSGIWGATPESWREGIYNWFDDGVEIGGDVVENVGDFFYDTSETIGGWFR